MKTETVIETETGSSDYELIYFQEDGEEKEPQTIKEVKEAAQGQIQFLRDNIILDLKTLWERIDKLDS